MNEEVKIIPAKKRLKSYVFVISLTWMGFFYGLISGYNLAILNRLGIGFLAILLSTTMPVVFTEIEYRYKLKKMHENELKQ